MIKLIEKNFLNFYKKHLMKIITINHFFIIKFIYKYLFVL